MVGAYPACSTYSLILCLEISYLCIFYVPFNLYIFVHSLHHQTIIFYHDPHEFNILICWGGRIERRYLLSDQIFYNTSVNSKLNTTNTLISLSIGSHIR